MPEPRYFIQVVIFSLLGVFSYEPHQLQICLGQGAGDEPVQHAMIGVVEHESQRPQLEVTRAAVVILNVAHQRCHGLAVFTASLEAVEQSVTHGMRAGAEARRIQIYLCVLFGNPGDAGNFVRSLQHLGNDGGGFLLKIFQRMQTGIGAMGRRAVIALQIVLDGEFPVGIHPIGFPVSDLGMIQIIGAQRLANILKRRQQVACLGVTVDEHQAHIGHASDRFQSMGSRIKVRHHMGFSGGFQRTVNVVNPTVIGANIGFAVPDDLLADPCATMATDVVHRDDLARFGPRDDDRILANFDELIVTGRWNFAGV